MSQDITIINWLPKSKGRLYYFEGNFYHPWSLIGNEVGLVKKEIRKFYKENKELVISDRSKSDYKNLLQLFDEQ